MQRQKEFYTQVILLRNILAASLDPSLSSEELAMVEASIDKCNQKIQMLSEEMDAINQEAQKQNRSIDDQLELCYFGQQATIACIQMGEAFPSPESEMLRPRLQEKLTWLKGAEENLLLQMQHNQLLKLLQQANEQYRQAEKAEAQAINSTNKFYQSQHNQEKKVRVVCRIRPFANPNNEEIIKRVSKFQVSFRKSRKGLVDPSKKIHTWQSCKLNYVYPPQVDQQSIFSTVTYMVYSAFNCGSYFVLSYGQPGSGKTHTMTGPIASLMLPLSGEAGILPRAIQLAFLLAVKQGKRISIQYREFYDKTTGISSNAMVQEQTWPNSVEQAISVLATKVQQRRTRQTKKNGSSSRSHLLVCLRIYPGEKEAKGSRQKKMNAVGRISFFDMAGNQRMSDANPAKQTIFSSSSITETTRALSAIKRNLVIPWGRELIRHIMRYLKDSLVLVVITLSSKVQDEQLNQSSISFAQDIGLKM